MADEFNASFTEGGIIHDSETGADGKSAYEIAVENGFDGTVTEWLASLKGEKGDKGDRGEQGVKGDKGDKGADGSQGIQGERGEKGETGEKGADGVNGKDGKDGVNGADGKSAYELAVDNGFSGTLAEWFNSLKGSDGKDGKDGAKGDKGDKGDTGAQGLKGDSGVEQQIVIDSAVTSYAIKPNILYVFPELAQLDVSFDLTDYNPNIVNDFHFQFTNGSTPCELSFAENVNVGDLDIQADTVCEISIVNGLLSYQNWSTE